MQSIEEALVRLARVYGKKPDPEQLAAYATRLGELDRDALERTLVAAEGSFRFFPSLKELLELYQTSGQDARAEGAQRGMQPLAIYSGRCAGRAPPWGIKSTPERPLFIREERGPRGWRERLLENVTGIPESVGTYEPDDLGFWHFIPAGRKESEVPGWNHPPRGSPAGTTRPEFVRQLIGKFPSFGWPG